MLLVVCREDCKKQKAVKSHLSRCWSTRKDWWPSYHFTFKTTSSAAQSDLLASKILIASVLLGEGILHNFTENNTALKRPVIKFLEYWYRFFFNFFRSRLEHICYCQIFIWLKHVQSKSLCA